MSSHVTPGTLSEMDMILCITQQAINKQFQLLYNSPRPKDPERYLIDHTIKLGYTPHINPFTHKQMPGDTGITAWIGSPTVDFTNIDPSATPHRSLRFSIPLKAGWIDMVVDGTVGRILFGDWKLSWMASLGSKPIQAIEEEILHPSAQKGIQNASADRGLPSSDFLASSLFCLFENAQISSTFQLVKDPQNHGADKRSPAVINSEDPENPLAPSYQRETDGTLTGLIIDDPTSPDAGTMVMDFVSQFSKHFADLGNTPNNPNPYVLGYSVTQNTASTTKDPIPALVPQKFQFSTTPASSKTTAALNKATLNFCMLGIGPHDDFLTNADKNSMAGIIPVPYGDVTRQGPSSDGILAFSRNVFCEKYIILVLADMFSVPPVAYSGMTFQNVSEVITPIPSTGNKFNRTWNYSYAAQDHDEGLDWRRTVYSGTNTLDIVWSSTLTDNPGAITGDDSKRDMIIKINGHVHVNIHVSTTVKGPAGGKTGHGKWNDGGDYWADVDYNATLTLTTGSDGSWNFVPSVQAQVLNLPFNPDRSVKYKADHHLQGWVAFTSWLESLTKDVMKQYFNKLLSVTISKINFKDISAAVKTLNTRIIMPAGDVFEFKGLDTDAAGNVYTHLTYKSIIGG